MMTAEHAPTDRRLIYVATPDKRWYRFLKNAFDARAEQTGADYQVLWFQKPGDIMHFMGIHPKTPTPQEWPDSYPAPGTIPGAIITSGGALQEKLLQTFSGQDAQTRPGRFSNQGVALITTGASSDAATTKARGGKNAQHVALSSSDPLQSIYSPQDAEAVAYVAQTAMQQTMLEKIGVVSKAGSGRSL